MVSVVGPLLPAQVDQCWPQLSAGFEKSSKRSGGDIAPGELWQGCRNGNLFLLIAHEDDEIVGASVWKLERWQTGMKFRCLGLYGARFREWIENMHTLATRVAQDCGATSLISDGRPGWKAIFPKAKVLRLVYEEPI